MGIFDRFRRAYDGFRGKSTDKSFQGQGYYFSNANHPIMAAMQSAYGSWDALNPDPRARLDIYRLTFMAFPFCTKAVNLHADMLGRWEVVGEDPSMVADLNKIMERLPVVNERGIQLSIGASEYAAGLLMSAMRDGMGFGRVRRSETGAMEGMKVYAATGFQYVPTTVTKYDLQYTGAEGIYIVDQSSKEFHAFRRKSLPECDWGLPLLYGCEFMGEILIKVLVSRKNAHVRLGNPPSLTTISVDPEKNNLVGDSQRLFMSAVNTIKEGWKEGVEHMNKTGKPVDMVFSLPAAIKMDTHMFGDGASGLTNYPPELEIYRAMLAQLLEIPVDLLDMSSGSAGIGADKFRILNGLLVSTVDRNQRLLRPYMEDISRQWLAANGVPPRIWSRVEFDFSEPDVSDKKLIAEIEKLTAEAESMTLDNGLKILQNSQESDSYLNWMDSHGMGAYV